MLALDDEDMLFKLDDLARTEEEEGLLPPPLPRMMYPDEDPCGKCDHPREAGKVFNTPTHPTPTPLRLM